MKKDINITSISSTIKLTVTSRRTIRGKKIQLYLLKNIRSLLICATIPKWKLRVGFVVKAPA